jgi:hypothetical protein
VQKLQRMVRARARAPWELGICAEVRAADAQQPGGNMGGILA